MRVLIACEYSGVERRAFKEAGHDAWSCDLLESDDDSDHHLVGDVMQAMLMCKWDLIILHPPCTAIALCGNAHYGKGMPKHRERLQAIQWTLDLWSLAKQVCSKVAMENPKNVMGPVIGKRTQSVHPYEHGHTEMKETWLWLHGLPPLAVTNNVYEEMMKLPRKERERIHFMSPGKQRGHERSRAFPGIAKAMTQWAKNG